MGNGGKTQVPVEPDAAELDREPSGECEAGCILRGTVLSQVDIFTFILMTWNF